MPPAYRADVAEALFGIVGIVGAGWTGFAEKALTEA